MNADVQLGIAIGTTSVFVFYMLAELLFYLGKRSAEKKFESKIKQQSKK